MDTEGKRKSSLSRMHDELFLKDTRYACDYWEEHKSNFESMLNDLLTEESLLKIMSVAKETSLMFNEKINALSKEDNEGLVRGAYDKLELLVTPKRFDDENTEEGIDGKKFLFLGMDRYFSVVAIAKEESGKPLSEVFMENQDKVKEFLEPLVTAEYSLDNVTSSFAPQLLIYFSYLLWKYDQAMEGALVSDYFSEFKRRKERLANPDKVQEIWTTLSEDDTEELQKEGIETEKETETNGSAGQKSEAWIFQESASRQRDAVEGYWTRRGSEIREKYNQKTKEQKKELLEDMRNVISSMGNGTYQNALMYCPELNPAKLSGINMSSAPYSVYSFEDLVEFVRKQTELPKITPKNHQEILDIVKSKSYGDEFIFNVSKKIGTSSKLLPLVAVSRQHLLFVFCHLVFVQVLGLPLCNATETIPGCADEGTNSSSESLNIPFSTREQRDATPIGKPPMPNLAKKKGEQTTATENSPKIEEVVEESGKEDDNPNPKPVAEIRCAEPSCRKRQKENEKFQVCSFCKKDKKSIAYCSKQCQIIHWRGGHKTVCFKNKS